MSDAQSAARDESKPADPVVPTPAAVAANPDLRVVDGEQQQRIVTTNGCTFMLRTMVAQPGWANGAKEFARARKLGKAIPKLKPPTDDTAKESWELAPCEFWLSDRLREHARKCCASFLDRAATSIPLDDDNFETLLIRLGVVLKDD